MGIIKQGSMDQGTGPDSVRPKSLGWKIEEVFVDIYSDLFRVMKKRLMTAQLLIILKVVVTVLPKVLSL